MHELASGEPSLLTMGGGLSWSASTAGPTPASPSMMMGGALGGPSSVMLQQLPPHQARKNRELQKRLGWVGHASLPAWLNGGFRCMPTWPWLSLTPSVAAWDQAVVAH